MGKEEILNLAIMEFGGNAQKIVAMEECGELIQAISKDFRGLVNNVAEEIADVEIMLEQLKIIYHNQNEVEDIKTKKISRLESRLNERLSK